MRGMAQTLCHFQTHLIIVSFRLVLFMGDDSSHFADSSTVYEVNVDYYPVKE